MIPEKQRIYGTLDILSVTEITELSNVKIEITPEIIEQVLNSQVAQITVKDPIADKLILVFNLGNRMPTDMQKIYEEKKIKQL